MRRQIGRKNMEYMIPACSGEKINVKKGQAITVVDVEGGQVVDFFAEATGSQGEFLSTGVTIDCNESLRLSVGDTIYTNLYRPMMVVIADDVGEHDLFHIVLSVQAFGLPFSFILTQKGTKVHKNIYMNQNISKLIL